MTFELDVLIIVAIYIWLPPASYVFFLTTLVEFALIFPAVKTVFFSSQYCD